MTMIPICWNWRKNMYGNFFFFQNMNRIFPSCRPWTVSSFWVITADDQRQATAWRTRARGRGRLNWSSTVSPSPTNLLRIFLCLCFTTLRASPLSSFIISLALSYPTHPLGPKSRYPCNLWGTRYLCPHFSSVGISLCFALISCSS